MWLNVTHLSERIRKGPVTNGVSEDNRCYLVQTFLQKGVSEDIHGYLVQTFLQKDVSEDIHGYLAQTFLQKTKRGCPVQTNVLTDKYIAEEQAFNLSGPVK